VDSRVPYGSGEATADETAMAAEGPHAGGQEAVVPRNEAAEHLAVVNDDRTRYCGQPATDRTDEFDGAFAASARTGAIVAAG
jgi:hypothetical protein